MLLKLVFIFSLDIVDIRMSLITNEVCFLAANTVLELATIYVRFPLT